ncbi:Na+-driven multidrug efflux pump [Enhygromyxa salina]|uniref:Na+-driven multidrug efflux pump n=1 Tax=Enhygromyxa salina TaxID=215803 RepID=A0A0C1ZM09_9BACT|nr:Na+-driven multidrug efflux pump [Enhygromyxa salina]
MVGVVGSLGAGWIAQIMAPPGPGSEPIQAAATVYMRVGFCAYPAVFVAAAGALILNGSGDTKTTFWIGGLANVVNIVANYTLIYGVAIGPLEIPELGPAGAALGTVLAYALACGLTLAMLRRPSCPVQVVEVFGRRATPAALLARRELVRLSSPAILERLVIHVGYVSYAVVVAALGATVMAANQALLTLESICFLGAEGFGVAAATVVGQFLGRRDPDGSGRGGGFAALSCALALSGFGLLIWATAAWTLPMFVAPGESGEALIEAAQRAMPILVIAQPMMAIAVVLGHGLRGAGDTRSPVVAALFGGLLVRVIGCWMLGVQLGLGLRGVWIATALDWTLRSVILGVVFLRGRWRSLEL